MSRHNHYVKRRLPSHFKMMVSETLGVMSWAALIPVLMWLGGAVGF